MQPDRPTVQGLVADACERLLGGPVRVVGASRTDAGVHAIRQVASVETGSRLPVATVQRALNARLPASVRVTQAWEAPPGFDARRSAYGKRYLYLIDRSSAGDPFLQRYAWRPGFPVDPEPMAKGLRLLLGRHDFSAFCAAPGRHRTPYCTLRAARLIERGPRLAVVVSADSFLHHMVRNIVGTLMEVGRGARPPEWVAEVLSGRDRAGAGPTAPPHGLFLVRVLYPGAPGFIGPADVAS